MERVVRMTTIQSNPTTIYQIGTQIGYVQLKFTYGGNKGWAMTLLQLIRWLEIEHLPKEEKGDTLEECHPCNVKICPNFCSVRTQ
jgi:hypothetical protein